MHQLGKLVYLGERPQACCRTARELDDEWCNYSCQIYLQVKWGLVLHPKLAANGIRKNRRTYLPYILTCSGMIMMYYIVSFLTVSSFVAEMKGGQTMQLMLILIPDYKVYKKSAQNLAYMDFAQIFCLQFYWLFVSESGTVEPTM